MAPPLFFLPNAEKAEVLDKEGGLRRDTLAARGIAHDFDGVGSADDVREGRVLVQERPRTGDAGGPSGHPGVVLVAMPASGEPPARWGYTPESQDWQPTEDGTKRLWIGLDRSAAVTPACVQRANVMSGYRATLGDGAGWLVPVIRAVDAPDVSNLPRRIRFRPGPDGRDLHRLEVAPEYVELWQDSGDVFDRYYDPESEQSPNPSDPLLVRFALAALRLNYRLGPDLLDRLRLIDTAELNAIAAAAVDLPGFLARAEAAKKNGSRRVTPSFGVGSADTDRHTDPAASNSTKPAATSAPATDSPDAGEVTP